MSVTSTGARRGGGQLAFVAVSTLWMPALFSFLLSNSHYAGQVDAVGLLVVVAHFILNGLPLALGCFLIRRAGHPRAAWVMLGVLGTVTAVYLFRVTLAAGSGPGFPLEKFMWYGGLQAAIISLPAWLGLGVFWDRKRRQ